MLFCAQFHALSALEDKEKIANVCTERLDSDCLLGPARNVMKHCVHLVSRGECDQVAVVV